MGVNKYDVGKVSSEIINIVPARNSVLIRAIPFSKAHWGNFILGYLLPQFNFVDLHILNSILHLELHCATPSSHILIYLIHPTPALQINFRSPPWVTFENGIALRVEQV